MKKANYLNNSHIPLTFIINLHLSAYDSMSLHLFSQSPTPAPFPGFSPTLYASFYVLLSLILLVPFPLPNFTSAITS